MSEEGIVIQPSSELGNIQEVTLKRKAIPKRISMVDVPEVIKSAMGVADSVKNFNEIIEQDANVQKSLQQIKNITENLPEPDTVSMSPGKGQDLGVKREALEKRNNTIIDLYCMGLTYRTILTTINDRNKSEYRGHIETEKSLRRIVADYFSRMKPSASEDMNAYDDAMREASYAAQEKAIERLTMIVVNRKEKVWKSDFEYAIVLEKLIQAHQLRIENRGWNKSRGNPLAMIQQNNQINIINQNVDSYATTGLKEEKVQKLLDKLDSILGD